MTALRRAGTARAEFVSPLGRRCVQVPNDPKHTWYSFQYIDHRTRGPLEDGFMLSFQNLKILVRVPG